MRFENYPSASEVVRNLEQIRVRHEVLVTDGRFRIVRFQAPFFDGREYWVVNEKGFMWEPADSWHQALTYLETQEAKDYQAEEPVVAC
ncbi:MAG TPA: hypothetical protein VJ835_02305 [Fimbriimonadaceae bacterium]|nr:hypothetical protein [Fimbriimonadaceae bacterium]